MSKDAIPDWALVKAGDWVGSCLLSESSVQHLARYIAEHEEEPVDPLEEEIEAVLADPRTFGGSERAARMTAKLALKRGIEIGKGDAA